MTGEGCLSAVAPSATHRIAHVHGLPKNAVGASPVHSFGSYGRTTVYAAAI